MSRRTKIISLIVLLILSGISFKLISDSSKPNPTSIINSSYSNEHQVRITDLLLKAKYYKLDSTLIQAVNKIDFKAGEFAKSSYNSINELEDRVSEEEDKLKIAIYSKTHSEAEVKKVQEIFTKAWGLNRQLHVAIKSGDNQKVSIIESQFQSLETDAVSKIFKEVFAIEIPEIK